MAQLFWSFDFLSSNFTGLVESENACLAKLGNGLIHCLRCKKTGFQTAKFRGAVQELAFGALCFADDSAKVADKKHFCRTQRRARVGTVFNKQAGECGSASAKSAADIACIQTGAKSSHHSACFFIESEMVDFVACFDQCFGAVGVLSGIQTFYSLFKKRRIHMRIVRTCLFAKQRSIPFFSFNQRRILLPVCLQ